MMIYYIPFIGYVVAAIEWAKAQRAYDICHEAGGACWDEFHHTFDCMDNYMISWMSLVGFCLLTIVGIIVVGFVTDRSKT